MATKKLRYPKSAPSKPIPLKAGDLVRFKSKVTTEDLQKLGCPVNSLSHRLFLAGDPYDYYTNEDRTCFTVDRNLNKRAKHFYIPEIMLEKVPSQELPKIQQEMGWFNMYRELTLKTHPYTTIFK